jgi:hypothetical protein
MSRPDDGGLGAAFFGQTGAVIVVGRPGGDFTVNYLASLTGKLFLRPCESADSG